MRSSKLAVTTAWNHIRASAIYLPPQFRPLSSQSPAEPASTAVPASAAKQQNDNYNYEKSGHIHWVSPVGSALRIFTRVRAMHSNYNQRSASPFRSIDVFLRSADLVDQLFNSSEKRLARLLLLLANFGKEGSPEPMIAKISQETLAQMIGRTQARVSIFMNKFRTLGVISYNGGIEIHSSLLNAVLHDLPHIEP